MTEEDNDDDVPVSKEKCLITIKHEDGTESKKVGEGSECRKIRRSD